MERKKKKKKTFIISYTREIFLFFFKSPIQSKSIYMYIYLISLSTSYIEFKYNSQFQAFS